MSRPARSWLRESSHFHVCISTFPALAPGDGRYRKRTAANVFHLHSIIVVGLLISYLPQHYRIISRRTSEGISPYFVLLGTTSATAGFANILTLPKSVQDVGCCKELETFECIAGVLGVVQLGVQWLCFTFMFVSCKSLSFVPDLALTFV